MTGLVPLVLERSENIRMRDEAITALCQRNGRELPKIRKGKLGSAEAAAADTMADAFALETLAALAQEVDDLRAELRASKKGK